MIPELYLIPELYYFYFFSMCIIYQSLLCLQSGLFSHFERLGVGHAVAIYHDNLQIVHNNLYYFNIYVANVLGYENILSSKPVLADFFPPEPGKIVNATQDHTIWEQCSIFTPEEWQSRCISDTSLPNHR